MYPYPPEFSEKSQARVHAEKIRAGRDFEQATQRVRDKAEFQALLRTCILRVFLVFAEEAAQLGRQRIWSVGQLDTEAREFLRLLIIELHSKWNSATGNRLDNVTSSWGGSILAEEWREFERSPQWKQYEDLLLEVAEIQASSGGSDNSTAAGNPEVSAEPRLRRGYRAEVQEWMAREGLSTVELAAERLAISVSALKSIMSRRGKRRCSEATLIRILESIGYQGE